MMDKAPSPKARLGRRDFIGRVGVAAAGVAAGSAAACGPVAGMATAAPAEFRLYHEEYGDGPAVVFVHGAGGTHMSWWRQIPVFAREFRCITYDQRGFGFSTDVPNGPGRAAAVEDLKSLLDGLGVERASLVGQSMGGYTVLPFAATYPERVSKLVMSSTTGGYTDPDLAAARAAAPDLGPRLEYAASYAERDPEGTFLFRSIAKTNRLLADTGGAQSSGERSVPDIQRIIAAGIPVLFTVGERDTIAPPSVTKTLQAKMTGSTLAVFPESGHSTYWEMHEKYNPVVLDFLKA